jgi:short-subunit dehydrogenase
MDQSNRSWEERTPVLTRIPGKVAVITGASSGLGAEMARQLANLGWKVGLTARRLEELEAVAASIRLGCGIACVAVADAGDPVSTREAFRILTQQLGPVDLLIANAGVSVRDRSKPFSSVAFEQMVRVNLVGVGHAIEEVLPSMIERKSGQIVGISSLAAFRGLPGSVGYSASKAGLSTLLEGLRAELKPFGIAVTTVHPGYVRTPMTASRTNPQPFIMDADKAVRIILRGVLKRRSRVDFPRRMAALLQVVRILPDWLYDRLATRILLTRDQFPASSESETAG